MDRRERFEALYRAHAGAVRGYALRRTGAAVADDVVADVFLVAWRRLDDVPSDPFPWLLGVARRVLANRRRGDARQFALRGRLIAETVSEPSPAWLSGDPEDGVLRALRELAPGDREVLLLVAWEGLGSARAARVLGVRPGAFAMRLHRARRRLARALVTDGSERRVSERDELPEVQP